MSIKTVSFSLLLTTLLVSATQTNVVLASGSHDHSHHDAKPSPTGGPAPESQVTKVIKVTTLDSMRYEFTKIPELKSGDIVKFVVTNKGLIPHEFSIGDEKEQVLHREMMRKMPNMVHEDGNTITVKPRETKEIIWKFAKNDEVVFACNIPGHFEAGMFHKLSVR